MLKVPEVTVLILADLDLPDAVYAINKSCEAIEWGAAKFLGSKKPEGLWIRLSMKKLILSKASMISIFIVYTILAIIFGPRTAFLSILMVMLFDLTFGIVRGYNMTTSEHRGEMIQQRTSTRGERTSELGMEGFPYAPRSYSMSPQKSPSLGKSMKETSTST
tara:strand:+ start:53 stop:538 length:486 start_codon:yes stop_codon:yes gene_type:complete